ncbi:MAG: redoxin domain-containing protein [Phycisphaeraceae bacterium]
MFAMLHRSRVVLIIALFIAAPLFAADPPTLELGSPLPSFKLPGVDDKTYTEKDFAEAKVLALIFTCNHCPTAQAYEQRIIALHKDYRDKGVAIVAISPNDDKAVRLDELGYTDLGDSLQDMKIAAKQRGFTFPYLYDGQTQEFSKKLGVKATPHVFVFDAERKLRYVGRIDNGEVNEVTSHDLRNALDDLLAGREVKTATTRAFGCSTKWASKNDAVKDAAEKWAKLEVKATVVGEDEIKKLAKNEGEDYVLVNVWATWCGPCVTEFPELVTMQRMYGKRHFKLVTISIDQPDQDDKVLAFLKKQQAAVMTNLHWGDRDKDKLADALDAKWEGPVPYTVLIGPGGKVIYRKTGAFDPLEVKKVIADNLGRTYASRKK